MIMTIGSMFSFDAAHKLPDEEKYGKCKNLHGHRYDVEIQVKGEVESSGWLCDFHVLKDEVNTVLNTLDHSYINDVVTIPTVENIIIYVYQKIKDKIEDLGVSIYKIRIYETKNCYAEILCEDDKQ